MNDEQFIFRFADPALAERVRRALREQEPLSSAMDLSFPGGSHGIPGNVHAASAVSQIYLRWQQYPCDAPFGHSSMAWSINPVPIIYLSPDFAEPGRRGQLLFEGRTYRVDLLDLPTVVESYKTLDDANLLKTGGRGTRTLYLVYHRALALPLLISDWDINRGYRASIAGWRGSGTWANGVSGWSDTADAQRTATSFQAASKA